MLKQIPITRFNTSFMSKQVCFVVMPFGRKPTNLASENAPAHVNFDVLWEKAINPALEKLGYEAVRADEDLNSLMIPEMIERLVLADLVVADVSLQNPNVYYEVGIRHASLPDECVLLATDWSKAAFDIKQMRQIRYPLTEEVCSDKNAAKIKKYLLKHIPKLKKGKSPVFDALPGEPRSIDRTKTNSFKSFTRKLSKFQELTSEIRNTKSKKKQIQLAEKLLRKYSSKRANLPQISLELFYIIRDILGWESMLKYEKKLPKKLRELPVVKEQVALAISKNGKHEKAIAIMQKFIKEEGDNSERRGILGGRYKKLYHEAKKPEDREDYLDKAIENYQTGMLLDLNDYYPSCNLPRLYRTRGNPGDEERAKAAEKIALTAAQHDLDTDSQNPWIYFTLLGLAFDAGDVHQAREHYKIIRKNYSPDWHLKTTIDDLELSLALHKDQAIVDGLSEILAELKKLNNE